MMSALVFIALVAFGQGVSILRVLDGRIVNGEDASVGEIPYQVSLQTLTNYHFCGGSILNKNYVITAAHCVNTKRPNSIKVIAGTTDLKDPQSVHLVIRKIVHAGYNSFRSSINDIALLKVSKEFDLSDTISFVFLPEKCAEVAVGSVAVVSGWGALVVGGAGSSKLQRTDLEIADQSYCNDTNSAIGRPVYETQICAYHKTVETGSCSGDSGGPLTVNGTLIGLVSWAVGCADLKYPTVFTRVPEYIDWIDSHAV